MAMILKAGQTWTYKGVAFPNVYGRVIQVNINRVSRIAHVVMELYPSEADKDNPDMILEQHHFDVALADFDDKFNVPKLKEKDIYRISYEHIGTITDEEGGLKWGKFKSDEPV